MSQTDLKASIDNSIMELSEKHRMHRKIQFLLDIRGLLIINILEGDYVEFGVYRGEMMYAAGKILGSLITRYVGLDTFAGLPDPQQGDSETFVFEGPGFMAAPKEFVARMMEGFPTVLIEGDFRSDGIQRQFDSQTPSIAVLVIDANWPSSVEAALMSSHPFLQSGSIVYIDDYFVGTRYPNFNDPILDMVSRTGGLKFREFMTYPPCARAFLVEREGQ